MTAREIVARKLDQKAFQPNESELKASVMTKQMSVLAGMSQSNMQFYEHLHAKYFNKAKKNSVDRGSVILKDEITENIGTISSYSVSSKSKIALSINFKNSLYKKMPEGTQQKESTFDESIYFKEKHGKSKSRSRERQKRQTTIDNTMINVTARENFQKRSTFDDLKSRATDILLPTDYLNSRSSSAGDLVESASTIS